jgi:hydroxypyruvate reductase
MGLLILKEQVMDPTRLMTTTLETAPWGAGVARILSAALQAVDPYEAVAKAFQRSGAELQVAGQTFSLGRDRRVYLVGAGKAGVPMAEAASAVLGSALTAGLVIVKEGHAGGSLPPVVAVLEAGHPVPDGRGVAGANRLIELLAQTTADDLVICLISGGGSALLHLPAPGLSLEDLQSFTQVLLASGASINELNTLRKHLEQLKGGALARLAAPAQVVTLILSDVVGNPLDIIASGPTVPDPGTFAEAYNVLERYGIQGRVPPAVRTYLEAGVRGEIPETPKPGDPLFERVQNVLVGSNLLAAQAARDQAVQEGFNAQLLTTYLQGEAREAGRVLAAIARQIAETGEPLPRPACVVLGGETTVTIRGDGQGGRNQELALAAAADLAGLPDVALVTLATDGGDGPTDAAGAVVTGQTYRRASAAGLDPAAYLTRNDSYPFFEALGDLLKPGPTRTNVNDLAFVFAL